MNGEIMGQRASRKYGKYGRASSVPRELRKEAVRLYESLHNFAQVARVLNDRDAELGFTREMVIAVTEQDAMIRKEALAEGEVTPLVYSASVVSALVDEANETEPLQRALDLAHPIGNFAAPASEPTAPTGDLRRGMAAINDARELRNMREALNVKAQEFQALAEEFQREFGFSYDEALAATGRKST